MFSSPLVAVLLLAASALAADNATVQKVNVVVYYESLCPDSMKFFTTELFPMWENHMDRIDLELIPYGKATMKMENNTTVFECHHGEEECFGNRVQACVLEGSAINKPEDRVKMINCLMKTAVKGTPYPTKQCVETITGLDANIVSDSLEKCANSTVGEDRMKMMAEKTRQFEANGLTNVPTVVVNGKKDVAAVTAFKSVVCSKFSPNMKPDDCPKDKDSGASSITAIILLPVVAAIASFTL